METPRRVIFREDLAAFKEWLIDQGWAEVRVDKPTEVLRMTHKGKYGLKTLFVDSGCMPPKHLFLSNEANRMYQRWWGWVHRKEAG